MTKPIHICVCAFAMATSWNALAFEAQTHNRISAAAATLAINAPTLQRIGRLPIGFFQEMPSSNEVDVAKEFSDVQPVCRHGGPFSASDLVACGAMFEDFYILYRPLNHFLDPQHPDANGLGAPLLSLVLQLPDGGVPPTQVFYSAAEWALQDHPDKWPIDQQLYSYRDAEDYLWKALTYRDGSSHAVSRDTREQAWGLTFQSLGQVIHLLQDMASPQHTRAEWHYDKYDVGTITQISRYEQRALVRQLADWIGQCLVVTSGPACNYYSPVPIVPVYPTFATHFQSPRAFWESTDLTGLAQVTSRSFPSNLRNFREDRPDHFIAAADFPYPIPGGISDVAVTDLVATIPDGTPPFLESICGVRGINCKMRMIGAQISDPLGFGAAYNDRASSESIFDQDLKRLKLDAIVYDPMTGNNFESRTFSTPTINRFNIDKAYSLLIPRAVSYSAGLLNFFFRGEIGIEAPADGIYAIADGGGFTPSHPTDVDGGYRGFRSVRARLTNATPSPDGSPAQTMTNGKLWAILRFQRNKCFTDDFVGMSDAPAPLDKCLDPIEEIVISDPIDRTGVAREVLAPSSEDNPDGEELTFQFKDELPINAMNVLLQVVFRGTLGSEANKLVVSTIDLSEPTFFSAYNNTDYVYLGGRCYKPQDVASDPTLWQRVNSTCRVPLHPEDVMSNACYMSKFGFRLQSVNIDPPSIIVATEISTDGDRRVPPAHFSRFALLMDPQNGVDLEVLFRNPGLIIDPADRRIHVAPFRAHTSRTTPGLSTNDFYERRRDIKTWTGFAFMMDVESGQVAVSDESSCIAGLAGQLSPLVDDARFPVSSTISVNP
jgi:hypothetical protein